MPAQIGGEARAADDSCLGDKLLAIESWALLRWADSPLLLCGCDPTRLVLGGQYIGTADAE
jgi:hypothetical protein